MSKPMISLRVRPLKKWADVAAATQHGQRVRNVEHVDRTRTHLNVHYVFDAEAGCLVKNAEAADIAGCLRDRAEALGARWHRGAIVGTEIMFIASPAFFFASDGDLDRALAQSWADACIQAWEDLFPNQSVAARLDLDETSPHCSVFFLPLHDRHYRSSIRTLKTQDGGNLKVSHNKVFGGAKGPEILAMLQSWIAAEMAAAGFNLVRGKRAVETGAHHTTPAAGRSAIEAAFRYAEEIKKGALEEATRRREEVELEVNQILAAAQAAIIDAEQGLRMQRDEVMERTSDLNRLQDELEAERSRLQGEREGLLSRIQILDRVLHAVSRELDVEMVGSFWDRVRAIADILEDRRSGGGGPAYRPG
jgi:hypothetical protein